MWSYEGCRCEPACMPVGPVYPWFYPWAYESMIYPPQAAMEGGPHQHHHCRCGHDKEKSVPVEIAADTTTPHRDGVAGGARDAHLSLEYTPTGATPSVKVTLSDADGSSEWNITGITDGYHFKGHFATVSPGAKIALDVVNCTARLRWFEALS